MECIILLCIKFINILNIEIKMIKNVFKKNKRFLSDFPIKSTFSLNSTGLYNIYSILI